MPGWVCVTYLEYVPILSNMVAVSDVFSNQQILPLLWPFCISRLEVSFFLPSQTKAAFTRQYNKESHMTPYAAVTGGKKGRGRGGGGGAGGDAELYGEEEEGAAPTDSDAENSDNPDADAMIKVITTNLSLTVKKVAVQTNSCTIAMIK